MRINSLLELYIDVLRDMYDGEQNLIEALPKLAKASTSPDLAEAFTAHLVETKQHAQRLEQIFQGLGEKPGGEKCEAIRGLVAEGGEMIKAKGEDRVRDAGLIVAGQKTEHYEIAGYGSLCEFARLLGRASDETLLKQTLEEEKKADETLNQLAMTTINAKAAGGVAATAPVENGVFGQKTKRTSLGM